MRTVTEAEDVDPLSKSGETTVKMKLCSIIMWQMYKMMEAK